MYGGNVYLIVVYDISNDKVRLRVANKLKYFGLTRVQRSAFVGRGGLALAKDVVRASGKLIDHETDSVIVFVAPDKSVKQALIVGTPLGDLSNVSVRVL